MQSFKDIKDAFNTFAPKVTGRYEALNFPAVETEVANLRKNLEDPSLWENKEKLSQVTEMQTKLASLERSLESWQGLLKGSEDLGEYIEIAEMEAEEKLIPELANKLADLDATYQKLDLESLLSGADDFRNCFLNIHPGAGGTESHDWADMLYRAYARWCEKKGYNATVIDYQEGDEAGIKNVTLQIKGPNAYGFLKAENGVHRLVRISPFDSNKKRHTSFASVHISPELPDDIDIEVNEKDLRIDTYRASGAGGQHVNKTDSAVRMTHQPTGIVVSCQNERSQIKNRATAMKMLKARLYELAQEEKQKEIEEKAGERKDISWGNQIRSYVFHPYNMVKDLRTGYETSNTQAVMDGDFDAFIDAFLRSSTNQAQNSEV